jgi:preprotein translocase subunit YajC
MNAIFGPLIFFAIALLAWYVIFVFPQQKQSRERRAVMDAVKAGDEVVTYGGIFAIVKRVEDDWFILTVAKDTDIKVAKEAVVMRRDASEKGDADGS